MEAAFTDLADAARHGIKARRERGGEASGIVSEREVFPADDFEAAVFEQADQIALAVIEEVARNVEPVPALTEQKKLPAGNVRDLHDQATSRREQIVRGLKEAHRLGEMLDEVEHRDYAATLGRQRSVQKIGAGTRDAVVSPCDMTTPGQQKGGSSLCR